MPYIIKIETKFPHAKTGEIITSVHYYQNKLGIFPCYGKIEDAKSFDLRFEAANCIRSLGGGKRLSIVKVD